MNDIISPLSSKREYTNKTRKDKYQFGYRSDKKRNKNEPAKLFFFNQKINNLLLIIIFIINNFIKEYQLKFAEVYSSNITIKIKETGIQKIFFDGKTCYSTRPKFPYPDEVYINDEIQNNISAQYNFTKEDNVIKLVWYESRENWGCLFKYCDKITEIDFSEFDFSKSIEGNMMFRGCKSLTSLNINDFGKVKLKDGGSFFREIISMTSLNLSNFDMSEVTDIGWMFAGSTSLTSLDLSCLHSNNITVYVTHIFWNCLNLEYINLNNTKFRIQNDSMFMSTKKNFVICNNDERIIEEVKKYGCPIIDCSDNWRQKQKKINLENGECVNDCSETNYSKYNYKNECYENCPNRTYNNNYICEDCHPDCSTCEKGPDLNSTNCITCINPDKYLNLGNCVSNCSKGYYNDEYDSSIKICICDLDKCDKCSKESYEKNLCISCNNGYYPKFEEINIDNSYIDCYREPEGYYFDYGFYKSCNEACKKCLKNRDMKNHYCIECKDTIISFIKQKYLINYV